MGAGVAPRGALPRPLVCLLGLLCLLAPPLPCTAQASRTPDVPLRRILRTRVGPCTGIRCPDRSTCTVVSGAPTCTCPRPFTRLVGSGSTYVCSSSPLPNSDYLDGHNAARAAVGSPPLVWSASLAAKAASWAAQLRASRRCFAAVQPNRGDFGQNVQWQGFLEPVATPVAVNRWVATGANYSLAPFDPFGAAGCRSGRWQDCATYMQVVWQYTTELGCAATTCRNGDQIWICDYSAPGLIPPFYPFSPCYKTTCPGSSVCNPNLGTPGKCVASPCAGISCISGATCSFGPDFIPFCTCRAGTAALTNNACVRVRSPSTKVPQTSVAVFAGANFTGASFVLRPRIATPSDFGCVNLPPALAGKVRSVEAVWDVADEDTSGGTPEACGALSFWDGADCYGRAIVYPAQEGFSTVVQASADRAVQVARAISC